MHNPRYNPAEASSIFGFSSRLVGKTLAQAVAELGVELADSDFSHTGKGALGTMVEKFFFGYNPNSSPEPDFPEAGVELKVTPLKNSAKGEYLIKERLVIDIINYCQVVNDTFEQSIVYRKFLLMLIVFYLHQAGTPQQHLRFIYSVLWAIKDSDLAIIQQDYYTIVEKIKAGRAHELSESDTLYLSACPKGKDSTSVRRQPYCDIPAKQRAFALKPSYMRTILDFVRSSGSATATNTDISPDLISLVTPGQLKDSRFQDIIINRCAPYYGLTAIQIGERLGVRIQKGEKSRNAHAIKEIIYHGLTDFKHAEEIRKSGIIAKTIRVEESGNIREEMSFENINYEEVHQCENFEDSRFYEIVTSQMMFAVFRHKGEDYVFDRLIFTAIPNEMLPEAEEYWANIKANVEADTLDDSNNTFWRIADHRNFHVRPKAKVAKDQTVSPISGRPVKKKCYWLSRHYIKQIIENV